MLDRTTPPPIYMMGPLALPTPVTETLSNGLVLNSINGGSQDVNQLSLLWTGGNTEAPRPFIAKLMGIMLREGTSSMSGAQISEAIDFNGAMLKVEASSHHTLLNISALNSKTVDILPLLRDIITDPTFPADKLALYKEIEAKELLINKSRVMNQAMDALAPMIKGPHHPDAKVLEVSDIESVTDQDLRSFYRQAITADGCRAYLSGRLDEGVYDKVRSMLMSLPAQHKPLAQRLVPYTPEPPGYVETDMPGAVQAAVAIAIPAPARTDADYIPLRFTVIALGGYFGSRLMKNIREDKGYTYGIGAYLLGSSEGSYVLISAQADKRYVKQLVDEVGAELRRLAEEPLSQDEMIRLRQYISSTLMETLDSPFSIMDYYKVIDSVGLPKGYFEEQVRWARDIDQQKIMDMAARYLRPELMRISVCK